MLNEAYRHLRFNWSSGGLRTPGQINYGDCLTRFTSHSIHINVKNLEPIIPSPMSKTMLLTKRLTTFLAQNTTPQLPTLLLLSPSGKLLSSSSPLPASTLRTQATLACSLWALYQPSVSGLVSSSVFSPSQPPAESDLRSSETTASSDTTTTEHDLSTVTIQLSQGIMVIRALSCRLLFVAIGPSSLSISSPGLSSRNLQSQPHQQTLSSNISPPASPLPPAEGLAYDGLGIKTEAPRERELSGSLMGVGSGTPSEVGSMRSTSTRSASIMGIRRQAVEIGRFLDTQLEGFVMPSGERR